MGPWGNTHTHTHTIILNTNMYSKEEEICLATIKKGEEEEEKGEEGWNKKEEINKTA